MGRDAVTYEKIYKAGIKFLEASSLDECMECIVSEAVKLLKANHGNIVLKRNGEFRVVYSSFPHYPKIQIKNNSVISSVIRKNKVFVEDLAVGMENYQYLKELDLSSIIYIPIVFHNKPMGILMLYSVNKIDDSERLLANLKILGATIANAIKKVQIHEDMKKTLDTRNLFISMAAHEFRTPLTSINGYIQLLHNKLSDKDLVESRWIKDLSAESHRLTNLVKELLEISRIQSGKLHFVFKEYKLGFILKKALENYKFNYPKRKVIIKNHIKKEKDVIICDFDKILQVVNNLLENASKYSPTDSQILVELRTVGSYASLKIIDKGRGIAKKELPLIFQGFFKGSNSGEDGLGLGLYLANNIIKRHHGVIKISSKLNKGTAVEVRLPQLKD